MKGKLLDLYMKGREQVLMVSTEADFVDEFEELKDTPVEIVIKKYREKRSLDANAYLWKLIDQLSEKLRIPKSEIYRNSIRDIGGVSDTVFIRESAFEKLRQIWEARGIGWQVERLDSDVPGFVNAVMYYGSSMFDKKQMGDLIDKIVQDCKAVGITTETPDEIENLKSLWRTEK